MYVYRYTLSDRIETSKEGELNGEEGSNINRPNDISHLKGSFVKDIGEYHIYRWYSKRMFQGFARRQAKLFASFVSGNFSRIENLYKFIY